MKSCCVLLFSLVAGLGPLPAADAPSEIELVGIFSHEGKSFAVLEFKELRWTEPAILSVGGMERFATVTAIDSATGIVTIRREGIVDPLDLKLFPEPGGAATEHTLNLRRVHPATLLTIYQMLSHRTVLRGPGIPVADLSVVTAANVTRDEAVAAIATTLQTNGVTLKPAGHIFAFAALNSQAGSLPSIPAAPFSREDPRPAIAAHMMNFQQADLAQVVEVYQEIADRTVLGSPLLPNAKLSVRNATALTRAEGAWLLEALFQLHGMVAMPQGDKFAVLAPFSQTNAVPRFDAERPMRDADEPLPAKMINLASASSGQLLALYADVTRQTKSARGNGLPMRISLRSQKPLTRREAAYALEAIAGLNNAAFVKNAEGAIELVPMAKARKSL